MMERNVKEREKKHARAKRARSKARKLRKERKIMIKLHLWQIKEKVFLSF